MHQQLHEITMPLYHPLERMEELLMSLCELITQSLEFQGFCSMAFLELKHTFLYISLNSLSEERSEGWK